MNLIERTAFQQVFPEVDKAFKHWYEAGDLPVQNPGALRFLTREEFSRASDPSYLKDNLLMRALLNFGVPREVLFALPPEQPPVFIDFLKSPPEVYFSQEAFLDLASPDKGKADDASIHFGMSIIDANLMLLPVPAVVTGEFWSTRLRGTADRFLHDFGSGITDDQMGQAREIFDLFWKVDTSLRFEARGATVVALMEQNRKDRKVQPLIHIGSILNRRVLVSLGERVKQTFISRLTENYPLEYKYHLFDKLKQDRKQEEITETEDFLGRLGLGSYRSLFDAYCQSRIPEIYRQWQQKPRKNSPPDPYEK